MSFGSLESFPPFSGNTSASALPYLPQEPGGASRQRHDAMDRPRSHDFSGNTDQVNGINKVIPVLSVTPSSPPGHFPENCTSTTASAPGFRWV